jgi:hypothetical protein
MSDEVVGAIVGAVITAIIGLAVYLYQQRKGNRVIVKMISQTPQIIFSDSVQKKLEIIYNGRKVDNLVLTQFVIFNQGSNTIKPLNLIVTVKPKSDNFTYAEVDVNDTRDIALSSMNNETGAFQILRPYLNPKKKYPDEEIKVSVFSDVLLDFSVNGGGEDWGAKLTSSLDKGINLSFTQLNMFFVLVGLLLGSIAYRGIDIFGSTLQLTTIIILLLFVIFFIIPRVVKYIAIKSK